MKDILNTDPNYLKWDKIQDAINWIILIIEDEINRNQAKKKQTEIKKEQTEKKQETINLKINSIQSIYENFPEEFKYKKETADPELEKQVDSKLTQAVKDKLKAWWINEERYKNNLYTALKLSKDNSKPIENKVQFIKEFNALNKLLDIDIQIPVSEKKEDEEEWSKTETTSLKDLDEATILQATKSYINSEEEMFDTETFDKTYIADENILKLYEEKDVKEALEKALEWTGAKINLSEYFDDWILDTKKLEEDVGEEVYQRIEKVTLKFISEKKEEVRTTTNTLMKERIMVNVFEWLKSYFDASNIHEENFAEDFEIQTENGFIQGKEMTINGSMNGHPIGFYYNMETGTLEMDDNVHIDKGVCKIGAKNWWRFKLPTKMPMYQELVNTCKNTNINEIVENTNVKNIEWYQAEMKNSLDNDLSSKFSHTELNKYYIQQYNEKNIAMQENLWYISDNLWGEEWIFDFEKWDEFTTTDTPQQFKLLRMMDQSMEYYRTSGQYTQIRDAFERFNTNIGTDLVAGGEIKEPLISDLFNEDAMAASATNRKDSKKEAEENKNKPEEEKKEIKDINYTTLYSMLITDETTGIIDLEALQKINNIMEKNETIEAHSEEFSSSFMKKYRDRNTKKDQTSAPEILKLNDDSIRNTGERPTV